jgi:hypothetical protein
MVYGPPPSPATCQQVRQDIRALATPIGSDGGSIVIGISWHPVSCYQVRRLRIVKGGTHGTD